MKPGNFSMISSFLPLIDFTKSYKLINASAIKKRVIPYLSISDIIEYALICLINSNKPNPTKKYVIKTVVV